MNERIATWWFLPRRMFHRSKEPGAALFQGIRIRLTLWYCGVLCAALLVSGIALYIGVQYLLFSPVQNELSGHLHEHMRQLVYDPYHACSSTTFTPQPVPPDQPSTSSQMFMPELVACFDQHGSLLLADHTTQLPAAFLNNSLAKTALQQGTTTDIVDGGNSIGPIYRYAQSVSSPDGVVHVMQVGMLVNTQETALSDVLLLLFLIGGVSLLGAGLGGLFLANRALVPARLAFTRQQGFIADASHELRTPLTLMRADAEVLLRSREKLAEEDAALLEDIVAEAHHMATLANSMLTLARLDGGSEHREHEVLRLDALAEKGVRRVLAFAEQMGVTVHEEYTDSSVVIGDPLLLEQLVLILLDNAIKYNHRGGQVTIQTSIHNGQAQLEVRDTGIGIAPEHLPHLVERFYRVDKARTREAGGTGLGLSIAHGIATVHGGTLTLTSIPDQGTTVTLQLPLARNAP